MGRIAGKVAIVLGASAAGNIGQVIARRFAEEGAKVMIAGRREDALKALGAEIGVAYRVCDITKGEDIEALVAATKSEFGKVDIGVNSTGWGLIKPFLDCTREDLDQMTAVQFTGPFMFLQALVKAMDHGGSIIEISSVTARIMFDSHAAYMGTKAGIDHVIRCVAHEFGGRGIRANSISPGGTIDAPMSGGGLHIPAVANLYNREIPLARPGTASDVANAALWLASDESSFVTGENIQVNGGQALRRNPSLNEVMGAMGFASA